MVHFCHKTRVSLHVHMELHKNIISVSFVGKFWGKTEGSGGSREVLQDSAVLYISIYSLSLQVYCKCTILPIVTLHIKHPISYIYLFLFILISFILKVGRKQHNQSILSFVSYKNYHNFFPFSKNSAGCWLTLLVFTFVCYHLVEVGNGHFNSVSFSFYVQDWLER